MNHRLSQDLRKRGIVLFLPGDRADYFCSILRFSVETGDEIPVFIPRIELGESQMDDNKTVYRVTVEHNGVSKNVPLIWGPIDLSVEPPQPPMLKQNTMSIYYYMTSFSQFLPMINNAFKEALSIVGSEAIIAHFLILIRKHQSLIQILM